MRFELNIGHLRNRRRDDIRYAEYINTFGLGSQPFIALLLRQKLTEDLKAGEDTVMGVIEDAGVFDFTADE